MRGHTTRQSIRRGQAEGGAATIAVLVTILALVAGCAAPVPSTSATESRAPGASPARSAGPAGSGGPGESPEPTPSIDPSAWTAGVDVPPLQPVATFEPTRATSAGALPDTAFRLASLDGSDPVALARRLVAEPALDLTITERDGVALVTPRSPLVGGVAYRFTLPAADGTVAGSWAVQAIGPLAVAGVLPEHGSTDVPLDTGIEIRFNQPGVTAAAVERHLRVEPAVEGRVEVRGRTAAFIPARPLRKATLYTVTLRAGLPLAGTDERLAADIVARFETAGAKPRRLWLHLAGNLLETAPGDPVTVAVEVGAEDDDDIPRTVDVAVHRLRGLGAAVDAWRAIGRHPSWSSVAPDAVPTDGLPLVLDEALRLERFEDWDEWSQYVTLPRRLDAGWYVVTVRAGTSRAQAVLQVTDLALYAVVTTTRSLAWVHDVATGDPAAGATVTVAGETIGRTGTDGIAVGATPATAMPPDEDPEQFGAANDRSPGIVVARTASLAVFTPIGGERCGKCIEDVGAADAWLVFATDRYEYRPTDTIHAWGAVRDRATGERPTRVEVTMTAGTDGGSPAAPVARGTARPDRNGAFVVELPVRDLPYGEYVVALRAGGDTIARAWVTVARILKPAWTIDLRTSRHAVVERDTVRVTASASFFEGTPVAGAELVASASSRSSKLTTDASGTGATRLRITREGDEGQWEEVYVSARPTRPEEGQIAASATLVVFEAGVLVRSEQVVTGGALQVTGSLHEVAFGRFEDDTAPASAGDEEETGGIDPYGDPVPGRRVSIHVIEHHWVRQEVGSRYDWVLKRVVPRYETEDRRTDRGTFARTTDGRGRFTLALDAGRDRSYEVIISAEDRAGRVTSEEAWADAIHRDEPSDEPRIELAEEREEGWSVGERVRMRFTGGGTGDGATYLWTTAQQGLRSWTITDGPRHAVRFRAADVPGFVVNAVRFTGRAYVAAGWEQGVWFRSEDRRLAIDISADRGRYRPGERATLTIRTRDAGGRPVPASVYVGVVDEKLVAMGSVDRTDPLWQLYESVPTGIVGIGWTHRDPRAGGGAEGGDTTGGGSEGMPRTDFRDWLLATIVRTGADGRATVSVDLSDDLTSWLVTAAGVSASLEAGRGEASIPVSLPFFAEVTVADGYLVADRPIVRVRAYGTALEAGEPVTFRVSSDTLPLAPVTVTAPAFRAAEVALPALSVGRHRIRVEARVGSGDTARRDALVRTFAVVEHRAASATVTRGTLDEAMRIPAGDGFTELVLADGGRGRVVPILEELTAEPPNRGDRALAAGVAARVLRDVFGADDADPALEYDLGSFSTGEGLSLLPYGGGSVELDVLAALADDPRLSEPSGWFRWREATTREERYWILAGQAATGQPVLAEIQEAAERARLTVDEQVALAIAAFAAGDESLAARLERRVLRDHGERYGGWVRVRAGTGEDATVLTARLAIVAASLGDAVAGEMDAYVSANPPRTTVLALERALAARGWAMRVPPGDASATLTVDGSSSTVAIRASMPVSVRLTPAQARTAELAPAGGTVVVSIRRDAPLDPASLTAPGWLSPVRSVTPGRVAFDDVVVVKLRMTSPPRSSEGCWTVSEWVPSGLVPIAWTDAFLVDEETGEEVLNDNGPYAIRGQRLDFCLQTERRQRQVTFRYLARVVTPGTYAWEPAVVQSPFDPTVGATIPATTIRIAGER